MPHSTAFSDNSVPEARFGNLPSFFIFDYAADRFFLDEGSCDILGLEYTGEWIDTAKVEECYIMPDEELFFDTLFGKNGTDSLKLRLRMRKGPIEGGLIYMTGSVVLRDDTGIALMVAGYLSQIQANLVGYLSKIAHHASSFDYDVVSGNIHFGPTYTDLVGASDVSELPVNKDEFEEKMVHPDDKAAFSRLDYVTEHPDAGSYYESIFRIRHFGGYYIWCIDRGLVVDRDPSGRATRIIGTTTDIDILRSNFERMKRNVYFDPLTGLHNRMYLNSRSEYFTMEESSPLSLVYIDVSGLKLINDYLGHNKGDELVCLAADVLQNGIYTDHEVIRLSGDEFLLLFPCCPGAECRRVMDNFSVTLTEKNRIREFPLPLYFGYGVATLNEVPDDTFRRCEERADARMRMYKKKVHESVYKMLGIYLEHTLGLKVDFMDKRILDSSGSGIHITDEDIEEEQLLSEAAVKKAGKDMFAQSWTELLNSNGSFFKDEDFSGSATISENSKAVFDHAPADSKQNALFSLPDSLLTHISPENTQKIIEDDNNNMMFISPVSDMERTNQLLSGNHEDFESYGNFDSCADYSDRSYIDVKENDKGKESGIPGFWLYSGEEHKFFGDDQSCEYLKIPHTKDGLNESLLFKIAHARHKERYAMLINSDKLGSVIFEDMEIDGTDGEKKVFTVTGSVLCRFDTGAIRLAAGYIAPVNSSFSDVMSRELSGDSFLTWNRESNLLHISNRSAKSSTGANSDYEISFEEWLHTVVYADDFRIIDLERSIINSPDFGDSFDFCVRMRNKDGIYGWSIIRGIVMERAADGSASKLIATVSDISPVQNNFENLRHILYTDTMTGLRNRSYFQHHLKDWENKNLYPLSVIYADVTGLKITNDVLGHADGDRLLNGIADILKSVTDVNGELIRLSGDEFLMLLPHTDAATAAEKIEKITEAFDRHNADSSQIPFFAGLGYAVLGETDKDSLHDCIERADIRMQEYKEKHRKESYEVLRRYMESRKGRSVSMRDSRRLEVFSPEQRKRAALSAESSAL